MKIGHDYLKLKLGPSTCTKVVIRPDPDFDNYGITPLFSHVFASMYVTYMLKFNNLFIIGHQYILSCFYLIPSLLDYILS